MALAPRPRTTRTTSVKEVPTQGELVSEAPKKRMTPSRSTLVLGTLLVVAISAAGYFYYQSKHAAQIADSKEIEDLTKTIGQFLELPTDETPTLATVTDREKLADQTFFLKAENGDKVLIYSQSGKAILYRPSTKKIVDMTSVNVNQPSKAAPQENQEKQAVETPQAEAPQVATVAIYNGGAKVGVTDVAEKQITAGLPGTAVTLKEKAIKNDYVGTTVVDVSGKNGEKASSLASLLGGTVGSLPQGEVTPQADIVVIIGNTEAPKPTPVVEDKKN
jgi:hypothetical protein